MRENWKDIGGNLEEEVMSAEKSGRYMTEAEEVVGRRTRLRVALRNEDKSEKHLRHIRGGKGKQDNGIVFGVTDRPREKIAISCRGPGPAERRKRYTGSRGRRK